MNYSKPTLILFALLGGPMMAHAQETASDFYTQYQVEIVLTVGALVVVVALLALFTSLYALSAIMGVKNQSAPIVEAEGFWSRLWHKLNNAVPLEEEATVMTDHSYDGIRELDNKLPPWWLYGFYLTIIISVAYILHFHVLGTGALQDEEYYPEMEAANAEVEMYLASLDNLIDESSVTLLVDPEDIATGKSLFVSKCAACHGQAGEGGVGPNLTDQYWIHGGDMKAIFKTIKYGVPDKGMISWQAQLSPKELQQISSFVYIMEGTDPPNAKEPQGELFEREGNIPQDTVEVATVGS
ncbi:cbb3-type cytochrome c oxidase N-terminal domain-containing protein [Marinoscillum sp.]|uniref:cbb3-type cytochrome c oxidase N-terminal domain-containing protein n=1 Tax=Marinoscillum sp. TaxID=2024838 RepID=UPI003BA899F4